MATKAIKLEDEIEALRREVAELRDVITQHQLFASHMPQAWQPPAWVPAWPGAGVAVTATAATNHTRSHEACGSDAVLYPGG